MIRYIFLFMLAASAALAQTYTVATDGSADFDNIQDAIIAAWHGDTIIVSPGLYESEDTILFGGRAITLTGTDPEDPNVVAATIINGTVSFEFGELADSVLEGFTFLNNTFPIITEETGNQESPAIYETVIVWRDNRNGNSDIYGMNLLGWGEFEICTEELTQSNPEVSSRLVVWQDLRNGNYDIYAYDLQTGDEYEISVNSTADSDPAVYESLVVWQDKRDGDTDIYGRDILADDPNEFPICTDDNFQSYPDIHGDIVVWQDNRNGNDDIYGKNLTTGVEFPICVDEGSQRFPAIYENIVVWQDDRNGNFDIYGKDLVTDQEFPICTAEESQLSPDISGTTVVWQDYRDGNSDIIGFDLTTATEKPICTQTTEQTNPAIFEDTVVWQDYRGETPDLYGYDVQYPECSQDLDNGVICFAPSSAPTIQNNTFLFFNETGINCVDGATPVITGNTFYYNGIGVLGGDAVEYNDMISNRYHGASGSLRIANNMIVGNGYDGIYDCNEIEGNLIQLNSGYGVYECNSLSENAIANNLAGGAAYCDNHVRNNIIFSNAGPALEECDGLIINNTLIANIDGLLNCNGDVRNNILAFHSGIAISGQCDNSYNCFWQNESNFYDTIPGYRNVLTDPYFVDVDRLDFHLKSEEGRWDIETEQWVNDDKTSRCIDAGDPTDDIGAEPNPNGAVINMGAYGGTDEASKSTGGVVSTVCLSYPEMDFNHDCKVNLADFARFAEQWLVCNLDPATACSQ